jgi:hypothetical protein
MKTYPWPMDILTKASGDGRKLITKPIDITPRDNIRPDENGVLRIVDCELLRVQDTILYPEVKAQGHFHFFCNDQGTLAMYGKRLNVNGSFPNIIDKLEAVKLPSIPTDTVYATELIWPGHPDTEVPTAIKDCPEELQLIVLGLPIYKGRLMTDASYQHSRTILQDLCADMLIKNFPYLDVGSKRHASAIMECYLEEVRRLGIEGIVFKEKAYSGWWKLKGIKEADCFITGCKVSRSETQCGLITSVTIGVLKDEDGEIIEMGSVTGFSLEEKRKMTDSYCQGKFDNEYIGKTLRVLYQEIAGKGKMKHGFFDGWRPDKDFMECKAEQFGSLSND